MSFRSGGTGPGEWGFFTTKIIREKYLYDIHLRFKYTTNGWALNRRLHSGPQCVHLYTGSEFRSSCRFLNSVYKYHRMRVHTHKIYYYHRLTKRISLKDLQTVNHKDNMYSICALYSPFDRYFAFCKMCLLSTTFFFV